MFRMEVDKLLPHTQYALPVGLVLIFAALVFVFGFKTVAEPKFSNRSSAEEKKAKKQAKPKDNKSKKIQSNGQANTELKTLREKRSSDDEKVGGSSPSKSVKKEAPKKQVVEKKTTESTESKKPITLPKVKAKATVKEVAPEDFDDGEWVQAVNKKDRKQRRNEAQIPEAVPAVTTTGASTKKKAKVSKEDKMGEQVKPVEHPVQEVKEELVEKSADASPIQAVIVEEPVPKEVIISPPAEEITTPTEPTGKAIEDGKPVAPGSNTTNKTSKSQSKKAPKKVDKETNNNENTVAPKESVKVQEAAVIEASKEVTDVNIPSASEPVLAEDQWQEIQAPKKKKKARRE